MQNLNILYEDEHLVAVEKPRGILTVATNLDKKNLLQEVKDFYKNKNIMAPRIRPIHRLDKGTSGIVLFAKTKECFNQAVNKQKFNKAVKTYLAIVIGTIRPKVGVISLKLPSRKDENTLLDAVTKYQLVKEYSIKENNFSLLKAEISSGKFHQIRRHFEMINHPLLMDRDYMDKEQYKYYQRVVSFRYYFLHAEKIKFKHFITGEPVTIISPSPKNPLE
ncbi:RluA family pseudouridine synthase [Candidatus Peregrinibacteria bacterium]|nr:RluA family pseudouridine synthase [Candidatus Peregrinibacteria bacterium]